MRYDKFHNSSCIGQISLSSCVGTIWIFFIHIFVIFLKFKSYKFFITLTTLFKITSL